MFVALREIVVFFSTQCFKGRRFILSLRGASWFPISHPTPLTYGSYQTLRHTPDIFNNPL